MIDLLTKENTLVEEKLLILEIMKDNFNRDSNIIKAYFENFNYFVSNFLEASICKEDKIKLLYNLFKILNSISQEKSDFSVEIKIALFDFLYKFIDREIISYKIVSYAMKIMNNTNQLIPNYLNELLKIFDIQIENQKVFS